MTIPMNDANEHPISRKPHIREVSQETTFGHVSTRLRKRGLPIDEDSDHTQVTWTLQRSTTAMDRAKDAVMFSTLHEPPTVSRQTYDAFLVLDVEATCNLGSDFNFPNEIIEFPVCLLRWKDKTSDGYASQLEIVDQFRSFVRPTWRPSLSLFCTELTGITQEQVSNAPVFSTIVKQFQKFMEKNKLLAPGTSERLVRFCWCTDGPWDVRDFIVKQCFISKVLMPSWIQGDVLDVRAEVWKCFTSGQDISNVTTPRALNISKQLEVLGLPSFEGRQHSGIDDARNMAKALTELGRRGVQLRPNTVIYPGRRWQWMGKRGHILEDRIV